MTLLRTSFHGRGPSTTLRLSSLPVFVLVFVHYLFVHSLFAYQADVGKFLESSTVSGPVKLTLRASPATPRLSDVVDLEVLVEGKAGVLIEPPSFGQAVGDFLVLDYSEKSIDPQGKPIPLHSRLFHYRLEPVSSGKHLIRTLAIEFTDNRQDSEAVGQKLRIESKPIEMTITSELDGQIPDLANLEPMLPPIELDSKLPWNWIIPCALLGLFLISLLWFTRNPKIKAAVVQSRPPAEIASEQLQRLLAENLPAQGLVKEFYLRLTAIVREFIEGSTGIRAPEQTTEEFLRDARLGEVFSKSQSDSLKEFLEAADMVKYAGSLPESSQIERSIERAREFIQLPLTPPVGAIDTSLDLNTVANDPDGMARNIREGT